MAELDEVQGRFRRYVAEWERLVHPNEETARPYEKYAVEYAQLAVKSVFLLLGGGLVSLAPILQHVSKAAGIQVIGAAVWFVGGLASAAACSALAYANFAILASMVRHQSTVTDYKLRGIYGFVPQPGEEQPEAVLAAKKTKSGFVLARWTMRVSILLGVMAYVCLVVGAVQIAYAARDDLAPLPSHYQTATPPKR